MKRLCRCTIFPFGRYEATVMCRVKILPSKRWSDSVALKGQCHEIFCFRFFSWITFSEAPENNIRIISNFFENSRRFSQVKPRCTTGVNDTGGKLPMVSTTPVANFRWYRRHRWQIATGINDTSGKFCHQFPLCCWHRWQICYRCQQYRRQIDAGGKLPPLSTTPAANNGTISDCRHLKGIFQPFELGAETSLIRSAVKFFKAGHFQKNFLLIQSHERSLKHNSAA